MQDRIKQMAEEATYYADAMDGSGRLAGRVWSDVRDAYFARLVAEDCARVVEPSPEHRMHPHKYIGEDEGVAMLDDLAKEIRARYAETKEG